ncbi:hypothetical protein [Burkholderia ubonensis]|nr:hypothetical protein [Burkholderia ubonensis]
MRAAVRFTSTSIASTSRDWHPLVALVVLYLIASAVAPAFGL